MNKYIIIALLLIGFGAGYALHSKAPSEQSLGGIYNANQFNAQYFPNGLTYVKQTPATLGVSTTTPAAFGSASGGFFTVSAGSTTFTASSTSITANTDINVSQIATTTGFTNINAALSTALGNRVCNTTAATSSPIVSIFASTTNPSLNGFTVTIPAPATNPACFSWSAQGY